MARVKVSADKNDPRKPKPPVTPKYATWIPYRYNSLKPHNTLGHAKSAATSFRCIDQVSSHLNPNYVATSKNEPEWYARCIHYTYRAFIIWEWTGDDWVIWHEAQEWDKSVPWITYDCEDERLI